MGDASAILAAEILEGSGEFAVRRFSSGSLCAETLISGAAQAATMGDSVAVTLASRYPDRVVLLGIHGGGASRHRLVAGVSEPKTIAVKFGTSTHSALIAWLNARGLQEGDPAYPRLVDMAPDMQLSALASGETDALAASEPTPTIAGIKLAARRQEGREALRMIPLEASGRAYPLVLVTTRRALQEFPRQIALLKETLERQGERVAGTSSELEYLPLLSEVTGMDSQVLRESLKYHFFGFFPVTAHREELSSLAEFLRERGVIQDLVDWERVTSGNR